MADQSVSTISVTASTKDSNGNSVSSIGYGTSVTSFQFTLAISNPQAGDTIVINIPANTSVFTVKDSDIEKITSGGTTSIIDNADGTKIITDVFANGASNYYSQVINFEISNN